MAFGRWRSSLTSRQVPNIGRAMTHNDEPDDHDLAAVRLQFGMWTWQSPVFFHMGPRTPPDPAEHQAPDGPSLEQLIARERPPVTTHFVDGALDEHATRAQSDPTDGPAPPPEPLGT